MSGDESLHGPVNWQHNQSVNWVKYWSIKAVV
jgi:hypothetical protein